MPGMRHSRRRRPAPAPSSRIATMLRIMERSLPEGMSLGRLLRRLGLARRGQARWIIPLED